MSVDTEGIGLGSVELAEGLDARLCSILLGDQGLLVPHPHLCFLMCTHPAELAPGH